MDFKFAVFLFTTLFLFNESAFSLPFKAGFVAKKMILPDGIALASYTTRRRPFGQSGTRYAKYFKPSTGRLDDLHVKAIVLDFGLEQKIALVSLDLVGIAPNMHLLVSKRLNDIGFNAENVFLSAVHTHAGPGGYVKFSFWEQFASDQFNPEILDMMNYQIESAIREADTNKVDATIAMGTKEILGVTNNRRNVANKVDPVLTILRVDDLQGKSLGTIINFPIHGTVLDGSNYKLSSDITGGIERAFEKSTNTPGFFFQAGAGDIAPETHGKRDFEAIEKLGTQIAGEITPLWESLERKGSEPKEFRLVSTNVTIGEPRFNALGCVTVLFNWNISGQWLFPFNNDLPRQVDISGFRIDDHAFVFIPGEIIAEIGLNIKNVGVQLGFKDVSIFSLTNHYLGYILNEHEYKIGGYESCVSFYGPLMGAKISSGAISSLNKMSF